MLEEDEAADRVLAASPRAADRSAEGDRPFAAVTTTTVAARADSPPPVMPTVALGAINTGGGEPRRASAPPPPPRGEGQTSKSPKKAGRRFTTHDQMKQHYFAQMIGADTNDPEVRRDDALRFPLPPCWPAAAAARRGSADRKSGG